MVTTPCRAFHPAACEILPCISSFTAACKLFVLKAKKKKKKKELTVSVCSSDATLKMKRGAMLPPALVGRNLVGQGQGLLCPRGRRCSLLSAPDVLGGAAGAGGLLQHCGDKTILLKKELHSGQGWLCLHLC